MQMRETAPYWRDELAAQRRTLRWLAIETRRPVRTVYAYAQGRLPVTSEWMQRVESALGVPVSASREDAA